MSSTRRVIASSSAIRGSACSSAPCCARWRAVGPRRSAAIVDQCGACGHRAISYNSCRNRHCPKCQAQARERWLAARERELLDVPYVHVVFTLPHALNPLCRRNAALPVSPAVSRERRHAARGRGRSPTPRGRDRLPQHPPHLGADARPASARPLRRAGRRLLPGSPALGPPEIRGLLLTREGPQSGVSRQIRRGVAPRVRPRRTGSRRRQRRHSATRPTGTPSSTRCFGPTGSCTRNRPSADPPPCSGISVAIPIASRSAIIG